jgi:hypothetical protein
MSIPIDEAEINSLVAVELELVTAKDENVSLQLFTKPNGEILYFPDRTLATLLQVNSSTLRGRFNRMARNGNGRLLFSDTAYSFTSSPTSQPQQVHQKPASFDFVHGMVALNHIDLVNRALRDWISKNYQRLGTSLEDIETNFKRAKLRYSRTGNIFHVDRRLAIPGSERPADAAEALASLADFRRSAAVKDRMDLDQGPVFQQQSQYPVQWEGFPPPYQFSQPPFPQQYGAFPSSHVGYQGPWPYGSFTLPAPPQPFFRQQQPQPSPLSTFPFRVEEVTPPPFNLPLAPSTLKPSPPLSKKTTSRKASISSLLS